MKSGSIIENLSVFWSESVHQKRNVRQPDGCLAGGGGAFIVFAQATFAAIHANVRSTTQRRGMIAHPSVPT